ncbi:hypothetical protein [Pseudomonas gingeri]|uniref:Uncharacterized protein n=1 Tax=Pseudomonas gingeri TaxID=117681 RepID=A0A7Y7YFV1_9PSED|nr:hypothetical protein [Pseudomonas gingeri]NWA01342.1 hypothetical protein [Pseudomonas gingeri]NWA13855.1 hypothetical protein [Pseudomonas gingeri]NWA52785.1 hypothetical protein [Pseudomonas gingeri]NWA96282.1 hypothetical protein [Pseudomonas gingeri]NWB00082.1 hypothetical protein [Pseudomonas gingeri]
MTSPEQPSVSANPDQAPVVEAELAVGEKPVIPAFSFPFKPAEFAAAKKTGQAWHQKNGKDGHHERPGRAPNGTRRSMGKR